MKKIISNLQSANNHFFKTGQNGQNLFCYGKLRPPFVSHQKIALKQNDQLIDFHRMQAVRGTITYSAL